MEQNRESGNRPPKVQYTDLGQRNKDSTIQQTGLSTNVDETKGISTCAKKKKKGKEEKNVHTDLTALTKINSKCTPQI